MSRQNPNEFDELDHELSRLFTRATAPIAPRHDLAASIQQRLAQGRSARMVGLPRLPAIAATVATFLVVALLVVALVTLRGGGLPSGLGGAPPATQTPTATRATLSVSSVALAVSPSSIPSGVACGSPASFTTFTYTATFTIPANTAGGTIGFDYTLNNGRSQTPASVTVAPGATSATYTFTSAGILPPDHTYPGPALVMVTSPNQVTSPAVTPTGACVTPQATATTPPAGAFQVTSVAMSVSPASIAGDACGSNVTVVYTATFHLAANGPGGTIHYEYTVNNGRGSTLATVTVAPGQTTASATFQWAGALPSDHTMPEGGGVVVDSPNSLTSQLVAPSGQCS